VIPNSELSNQIFYLGNFFWICKYNKTAVRSTSGERLKLWDGVANKQLSCRHIIVDWQKQF
jgi:hypothetical protein